jgi:hypothetical protein
MSEAVVVQKPDGWKIEYLKNVDYLQLTPPHGGYISLRFEQVVKEHHIDLGHITELLGTRDEPRVPIERVRQPLTAIIGRLDIALGPGSDDMFDDLVSARDAARQLAAMCDEAEKKWKEAKKKS